MNNIINFKQIIPLLIFFSRIIRNTPPVKTLTVGVVSTRMWLPEQRIYYVPLTATEINVNPLNIGLFTRM